MTREFSGVPFKFVGRIEPERDHKGAVVRCMPQARYRNAGNLPLNRHGSGPFCRFRIGEAPPSSGVYLVLVSGKPVYAGKCSNLARRFGQQGYGAIQPKNCFVGGQSTNCKVNHLILEHAERRLPIELWFHDVHNPGPVERTVIVALQPPWNDQVPW